MKKIHFFNLSYKRYKWAILLIAAILLTILIGLIFLEFHSVSPVLSVLYLIFYGYEVFKNTRHNSYFFINDKRFILKLDNKKLDVDATLVNDLWQEDNQLHLKRVNRVDSFNTGHLIPEHVTKLVALIQNHRKHA